MKKCFKRKNSAFSNNNTEEMEENYESKNLTI